MKKKTFLFSKNPLLLLLSALVIGIVLQNNLKIIDGIVWLTVFVAAFITAIFLHQKRTTNNKLASLRTITLLMCFVFLGAIISNYQNIKANALWYGNKLKAATALKLKVINTPVVKAQTILLPAKVIAVKNENGWATSTGDLLLYVYNENLIGIYKTGQTLIISNTIVPIKFSGNPFAFNQAQYAARKGLYYQCFLPSSQILLYDSATSKPTFIESLRTAIQNSIQLNVADSATKALIAAVFLNDRTNLDSEIIQAYSATGVVHIIAISGMHVFILSYIIIFFFSFSKNKKLQTTRYWITLIIVWIYITLTGFPPSAVRAAAMFSIYAIGKLLNRDSSSINVWSAAGLLLLCYNPYWIYDAGFQLSFLAVLSILLFTKNISTWCHPKNWLLKKIWRIMAISISVQILVFPLVIYYFNQFPLLSLVANIPAALFSTCLMAGAIGIFALHSICINAVCLGSCLGTMTKSFNAFILFLYKCSPNALRQLYIDKVEYWLLMSVVISLSIYLYQKKAIQLLTALCFSILLVSQLIWEDYKSLNQNRIVVYNLSNGSAIDLFQGKNVTHFSTLTKDQEKYTTRPAMLGFRVSKEETLKPSSNLFRINNKSILLLKNARIQTNNNFPIDVLIVSNESPFEPEKWQQIFQPKQIILDGSLPRWKAQKWETALQAIGVNVYWVQESGAWVYPNL